LVSCKTISPYPAQLLLLTAVHETVHSFYHPTEGRRLSRPGWLAKYKDGILEWVTLSQSVGSTLKLRRCDQL